jgi:membrane-bound ClpP family serine protease
MTILAIILLILLGILLLIVELLVIPGSIVAATGGVFLLGGGIYLSYHVYGSIWGHITLISTIVLIILTLVLSLKSKTWKNLMLHTSIDSKIETFDENQISVGDIGITISRLAPMGKVFIKNNYVEAKSINTFIDQGKEIVVSQILNSQIIVKLKN